MARRHLVGRRTTALYPSPVTSELPSSLDVVLDTNVLRPANELEFASLEAKELQKHQNIGLGVRVLLPQVVIEERIYQITQAHSKALGSANQVGRLLGHEAATSEQIEAAVRAAVADEVKRYGFVELGLDHSKVDWRKVAADALHRRPPFSPDKSEKGFRDRLVVETVRQLDEEVGGRYRHAILFVTGDERLRSAVFGGRVGVFSDVGQVVGWVNERARGLETTDSQVMRNQAEALFFGRSDSLFSMETLLQELQKRHPHVFTHVPPGFLDRQATGVEVSSPVLLDIATGKRLWRSRVEVISRGLVARENGTAPWPLPVAATSTASSSAPSWYGASRSLEYGVIRDVFDVLWWTGRGVTESGGTTELARKWFDQGMTKATEYLRVVTP